MPANKVTIVCEKRRQRYLAKRDKILAKRKADRKEIKKIIRVKQQLLEQSTRPIQSHERLHRKLGIWLLERPIQQHSDPVTGQMLKPARLHLDYIISQTLKHARQRSDPIIGLTLKHIRQPLDCVIGLTLKHARQHLDTIIGLTLKDTKQRSKPGTKLAENKSEQAIC